MPEHFDAIIIGAGQAGPALAARLSGAGWHVALVERHLFGGTCVNTGCTPTKALVASARVAHQARRAADFGITIGGPVSVDFPSVMARKDRIAGSSAANVECWVRGLKDTTVVHGHARLDGPQRVRVGQRELESDRIFLDVGGRAAIAPMQGIADVPLLTNSSLLALKELPEHLLVVGGSYVGLEFAQMFRRFGAQVTVFERAARVISREDPDVSQAVHDLLAGEGVDLRVGSECMAFRMEGQQIRARARCGDDEPEALCSHVLVATGRRPNTDDLGLDTAGVKTDARGFIEVNDFLETSVPGIWALGECNGRGAFTHTTWNDYEIVAANLLDGLANQNRRRVSDRILTYALFTDPPLARVGLSVQQAKDSKRPTLIGERPMRRVSRAVEKGEEYGFLRVLVDAESKQLVGATLLGVEADEAIAALSTLMYAKAPISVLQRSVQIHPTVSELLPTVLGELKPLE
ncbi:FAD-containing oxidoreductase [Ramlibacter sp. G-1-2-2]|uniref:FAD-containing oxidoreductase n=1 Tax=Ramlibacter agri TaxID=2728837 RepID=A0A848H9R0_9BURK|nr:FAD-containing oxidoreductase [Ramlibacter agri]NML47746.1 FAD-containing oxidoreductase [Ramlibacter agri]